MMWRLILDECTVPVIRGVSDTRRGDECVSVRLLSAQRCNVNELEAQLNVRNSVSLVKRVNNGDVAELVVWCKSVLERLRDSIDKVLR
jgi:hypothetical protein